jgi:hypothetical protein
MSRYNLRSSKSNSESVPVVDIVTVPDIEIDPEPVPEPVPEPEGETAPVPEPEGETAIETAEPKDESIHIEIRPSWTYGVYTLSCNNQLITIPCEPNAKIHKFVFDRTTPLYTIKNTLFNTIPLKGIGNIQTNLKYNYVTEKFNIPQSYTNIGKELNKNTYPCLNFRDIFEGDNTKPIGSLLKDNNTKLILYSHLSGTYTISNACSIC